MTGLFKKQAKKAKAQVHKGLPKIGKDGKKL
jgi:hypothetical protein